jgi:hypothetical protein
MSPKWSRALFVLLALAGIAAAWRWVLVSGAAAAPKSAVLQSPNDPPLREREGPAEAPLISFIDSPSAECYRPVENTDACYIYWNYLYVTASTSQYIISMTVDIDGQKRAYHSGFFQNYMYIPSTMMGPGYKVACGVPGSGGLPSMGSSHAYTLRARETGGLGAANYGSVLCPADVVRIAGLSLSGPATGLLNLPYEYVAATAPITATQPITYVWEASGHAPQTVVGGVGSTVLFDWPAPGTQAVTVTVSNLGSSVTSSALINIQDYKLYLPKTVRRR